MDDWLVWYGIGVFVGMALERPIGPLHGLVATLAAILAGVLFIGFPLAR